MQSPQPLPAERFLLVLANSFKMGGACVGGRELLITPGKAQVGPWLRPTGSGPGGSVLPHEIRMDNGEPPAVGDVVAIRLADPTPLPCQPENHPLVPGSRWRFMRKVCPRQLAELVERPHSLWLDPDADSDRCRPARLQALIRHGQHGSLHLIQPERLQLRVRVKSFDGNARSSIRALFRYQDQAYDLSLTDPVLCRQHDVRRLQDGTILPAPPGPVLACVSLSAPFHGFHYKLAAAIIPIENAA